MIIEVQVQMLMYRLIVYDANHTTRKSNTPPVLLRVSHLQKKKQS